MKYDKPEPRGAARWLPEVVSPVCVALMAGCLVYGLMTDQPIWFGMAVGFMLLGTTALWHGWNLYDQQTIRGISGRVYPRFEILNYLTPEMKARTQQFRWEMIPAGAQGYTPPLRGFRPGRDELAAFKADGSPIVIWSCPLGAAINKDYRIPPSIKVREEIVAARPELAAKGTQIEIAAERFIVWNDTGRILPEDLPDIFAIRPT